MQGWSEAELKGRREATDLDRGNNFKKGPKERKNVADLRNWPVGEYIK